MSGDAFLRSRSLTCVLSLAAQCDGCYLLVNISQLWRCETAQTRSMLTSSILHQCVSPKYVKERHFLSFSYPHGSNVDPQDYIYPSAFLRHCSALYNWRTN